MSLIAGERLGCYEILSPLGAGGMGEVYRARDTRLDRTVAIKILTTALAADVQLRDRFDREARAISSLNHPHICTLFDVGHQDGVDFLVLEYLEGETVAARLARNSGTALDPKEALAIAVDICGALDTAHRAGIVHRDLKPANVFIVRNGGAKLLDFGLAKSTTPAVAASGLSTLPTTPPHLTAQGMILGTFQYMAPEQIEGLEADARTDIFAFGALLFEMLTGRPPFEGRTRATLLGAILKDEPPPVSQVQPVTPSALDRIVSTCLAKDPDDRYQSARDLLRELRWVAAGASDGSAAPAAAAPTRSTRVPWLVAALTTVALIATAVIALKTAGDGLPPAAPIQFTIDPPPKTSFAGPAGGGTGIAAQIAVSPDGRHIVFVAGAQEAFQIWLRPVATLAARPIPGTEGGSFPFWSPDSRSIGFFADGKLKRVLIAGGPPTVLCDAAGGRGGTWSRDDVILFAPGTTHGLLRVSSAGGAPTIVTTLDPGYGETSHRWPFFLPDGRHFLYTASTGTCCPPVRPAIIRIGTLDPNTAGIALLQAESSAIYAAGHVLFAHEGTLMAQAFDADERQSTGDAFPLAEQISTEGSRYVSASLSESGTLAYAPGGPQATRHLTWFDRAGRALGAVGEAGEYGSFALSPDERRVAVGLGVGAQENRDIWIIDLARDLPSRLTFDPGSDSGPVWSPDGTHVVFAGQRSGKISLRRQAINGTAADEPLLESSGDFVPSGWSADGRFIAYTDRSSAASPDVWVLPLFGDRKPFPVAQTAFTEANAVFSPDGRWIAYSSNEGSQGNVYVQSFPEADRKYQVSRNGGGRPVWRGDGKELFYLGPDSTLMAVSIEARGQFEAGVPQALFRTSAATSNLNSFGQVHAVTKDGTRFLVAATPQQSSAAPLTVIVNWLAAVQK